MSQIPDLPPFEKIFSFQKIEDLYQDSPEPTVSFFNLQNEFILEPHWNYARIDQVIARGIRAGSHKVLKEKFKEAGKGEPVVKIYRCVASPPKKLDIYSID